MRLQIISKTGEASVQYFFSPKSDGAWKWGVGPQLTLKTRTNDRLAGAGWGGGIAGVIFGGSGQWSYGALVPPAEEGPKRFKLRSYSWRQSKP